MAACFRESTGSTVLGRVRFRSIPVALTAVALVRVRQELKAPEICSKVTLPS